MKRRYRIGELVRRGLEFFRPCTIIAACLVVSVFALALCVAVTFISQGQLASIGNAILTGIIASSLVAAFIETAGNKRRNQQRMWALRDMFDYLSRYEQHVDIALEVARESREEDSRDDYNIRFNNNLQNIWDVETEGIPVFEKAQQEHRALLSEKERWLIADILFHFKIISSIVYFQLLEDLDVPQRNSEEALAFQQKTIDRLPEAVLDTLPEEFRFTAALDRRFDDIEQSARQIALSGSLELEYFGIHLSDENVNAEETSGSVNVSGAVKAIDDDIRELSKICRYLPGYWIIYTRYRDKMLRKLGKAQNDGDA